jgi:hypothetical protein
MPGIMPIMPFHAAHLHHLLELALEVVHVELTLLEALHHAFGLFGLQRFLRLFDQRHDVAHAEDAAGDAGRLEGLQRVDLFAEADEADRLAGDRAHRQRRTAAPVAIHPGQDDAGDADALVEILRRVHRVLTGQAVDDQKRLTRVGDVANGLDLGHQLLVDGKTPGGVEHVDVVAAEARLRLGAFGDGDGVLALDDGQRVDADLLAEDGELFHGRGAVHVERGHQDALVLALLQALGDLGGGRGLAAALQADHQDGAGGLSILRRPGSSSPVRTC